MAVDVAECCSVPGAGGDNRSLVRLNGEKKMMLDRYALWTAVWEHFHTMNIRQVVPEERWDELYNLLNQLWTDQRKDAKPDELAAHAAALGAFNDRKRS